MARLITSGAEWNDLAGAAVSGHPDPVRPFATTPPTISSVSPRTGVYHWRLANLTSVGCYLFVGVTTVTAVTYSLRWYVRFSALPDGNVTLLALRGTLDSVAILSPFRLTAAGAIQLVNSPSNAVAISANAWVLMEYQWSIDAANAANNTGQARINGTVLTGLAAPGGTTLVDTIRFGNTGSVNTIAITCDLDDFAMNDSSGAAQTSFPGEGAVVLLKPTADSAVGTGWTLGTGTAIAGNSGKTAVANTPPVGVADLAVGSDPKQIRNAASAANANYDATLTTYTAAGVPAGATVNVVVPIVATAAPVVTAAKAGTIGVVSNPAITNVALGAGGTAGAFWSGVAGGTYSTGWKWSPGTVTYAPSVTFGTAPVARVTQVTASTRIAVVCALGMYVDYTPAAPAAKPRRPVSSRQVPVMRAVLR